MIQTSENNWYFWEYGDLGPFSRQPGGLPFKTNFKKHYGQILSFKEEAVNVAKSTLDCYPNLKPCLFFSGGTESEVALRSYLEIGVTPEVYIVRYEDDLNLHDISYAVTICLMLGVQYKIIDFNLKKFFENDAESVSEVAQIDRPRSLPQLKFMDYVDGLPIYSAGDQYWHRNSRDYSIKSHWSLKCWEHELGWSKYALAKNRPAVMEWFKWTPGLFLSYTQLNWFKLLTDDFYKGRLEVTSTKLLGYREAYPQMIDRAKYTGFEKISDLVNEFESYLEKKNNGLIYRQFYNRNIDQLWIDITGQNYLTNS